jgi:hypothetical protein
MRSESQALHGSDRSELRASALLRSILSGGAPQSVTAVWHRRFVTPLRIVSYYQSSVQGRAIRSECVTCNTGCGRASGDSDRVQWVAF